MTTIRINQIKPKKEKVLHPLNVWIGARFRQLRLMRGKTQKGLGEELGISRVAVVNIEEGTQTVNSRDLYNASVVLNVNIAEFFPATDTNGNFITQSEYREKYLQTV